MGLLTITEHDTFDLGWLAANKALYQQRAEQQKWKDIHFPVVSKAILDSMSSQNIMKVGDLTVQGGFVTPILAYSESSQQGYVIWIPEGWPNGGGWGFRSLYVDRVTPRGEIVVSNREDIFLRFDFPGRRVQFLDTLPKLE